MSKSSRKREVIEDLPQEISKEEIEYAKKVFASRSGKKTRKEKK